MDPETERMVCRILQHLYVRAMLGLAGRHPSPPVHFARGRTHADISDA
jgi:hypothetical protein